MTKRHELGSDVKISSGLRRQYREDRVIRSLVGDLMSVIMDEGNDVSREKIQTAQGIAEAIVAAERAKEGI